MEAGLFLHLYARMENLGFIGGVAGLTPDLTSLLTPCPDGGLSQVLIMSP